MGGPGKPPAHLSRLMAPDPRVEAPYQLTPQTMLRAGVLGAVMLTVFALLFLRLWSLEVLNSKQYLQAAVSNQVRTVPLPAPRGNILDRYGRVIVTNRQSTAIEIWPADLPKRRADQDVILRRLAQLTGTPLGTVKTRTLAALRRLRAVLDDAPLGAGLSEGEGV